MSGAFELFWRLYQNSPPAILALLFASFWYAWKHDINPRLRSLEQTQEQRGKKWDQRNLNAQEQTLIIDDNASRIDDVEAAVQRLRNRLSHLESGVASETDWSPDRPKAADGGSKDD